MAMRNIDIQKREDLDVIFNMVKPGDRVLDLGCGDGSFLARLKNEKQANVLGFEIDQDLIGRCIANGVPVIQSNLDSTLDFAEDDSFDLIILSHTIQELRNPEILLKHIVRAGKKAAVSVINIGHWRCRLQMLAGRMPRNSQLPYQWYNTPNIHLGTIADFKDLCQNLDIRITSGTPIAGKFPKLTKLFPNLFAVGAVFVLEKR